MELDLPTYSRVPNNRAARLLIFLNFCLPTRLIWTYTLIKFQEKILPTQLLCTYTVIDFSLFWLTRNICYLLTHTQSYVIALHILTHCVGQGTKTGRRKFWEWHISMICLCSKYFKNWNIFGQILNIWVKLILKKKFEIFFSMFRFA